MIRVQVWLGTRPPKKSGDLVLRDQRCSSTMPKGKSATCFTTFSPTNVSNQPPMDDSSLMKGTSSQVSMLSPKAQVLIDEVLSCIGQQGCHLCTRHAREGRHHHGCVKLGFWFGRGHRPSPVLSIGDLAPIDSGRLNELQDGNSMAHSLARCSKPLPHK